MAILTGNQMIAEAGFAAFSARKLAHKMGTLWGRFTMFSGPMSA